MRAKKGMSIAPKVSDRYFDQTDKRFKIVTRNGEKEDLHIGDTYNGLPILGETKELYVCKHKSGFIETFQKKNHRFGLSEDSFYYTGSAD